LAELAEVGYGGLTRRDRGARAQPGRFSPAVRSSRAAELSGRLAVIGDGLSISRIAEKVGVSRQTLHAWLARYGVRRARKWKRRERGTAMEQWQMGIGT
jgi:transposase-like protein